MNKIAVGLTGILLVVPVGAKAQSISGRVTGAVGGIEGAASSAGISGASQTNSTNPTSGSMGGAAGGALPGALDFKAGDRTIQFRGAAGVGDDRGNFKAGLGIPF
jgi:hypothetical protein